jgi:ornithine carbamoyltransferase
VTLAYVGDGANNMAHSYLIGGTLAGMHVRIGAPPGFQPDLAVVKKAQVLASTAGGSVQVLQEAKEAVADADVVATDTWISMGQEDTRSERESIFLPYAVTPALLALADREAIVLHCLPAYRGNEIEAAVIEGPQSVVWDEAENRRHVQKALLAFLTDQVRADG